MRNVLIIGAGRSASSLINYLLEKSQSEQLHLTIGDLSLELAQRKTRNHPNATAIQLDIQNTAQRQSEVAKADIVISMLPAHMHIEVAKDCIHFKKHMVTASYISEAMQALDEEAKAHHLVFMNEIGLDPESDTNLWNYKFTWAPRNVVLAGQGGAAKFIQEGKYKYIPYHRLFRRTEFLHVEGYGKFEAYANRDSLKYRSVYGLDDVLTLYRGTIRRVGYSRAWNMFVQLGMTDDTYVIENSEHMSYRDYVNSFLPYHPTDSVEIKMRLQLGIEQDDVMWEKLIELDLFNGDKKIGLKNATPAQILEHILTQKWTLNPHDKDMIVMYHKFGYRLHGKEEQIDSKMVCIGDDQTYTAMAKTVGLPVAMATLHILNGKITTPGVQLPIRKEVYEPILAELEAYGVVFKETKLPYIGYNPDKITGTS